MMRMTFFSLPCVIVGLLCACSGGGGVAGTTSADTGGACNLPPPPSADRPTSAGCAENLGNGWVVVPCACDLWVRNTSDAPMTAAIRVTFTPDIIPGVEDPPHATIVFEDPDASAYAAWKAQAASGDFSVTNASGETTVSLDKSIVLEPVSIARCATGTARGETVNADMKVEAIGADGVSLASTTNCNAPRPE